MLRTLLLLTAFALVASPVAWAKNAPGEPEEIRLANAPSGGIEAGQAWTAVVRVKPADLFRQIGQKPTVKVLNERTGAMRSFAVHATGTPGKYEARVVFPSAGRWTYGIAMDARFVADTRRLSVAASADRGRPAAAFAVGGIVALVLLPGAAFAVRRRRH
jgi:hypothetical protein